MITTKEILSCNCVEVRECFRRDVIEADIRLYVQLLAGDIGDCALQAACVMRTALMARIETAGVKDQTCARHVSLVCCEIVKLLEFDI